MKRSMTASIICTAIAICAVQTHSSAFASTLFSDSFDRPDGRDIQASLDGITDNTGSSLPIGGVYTHAHVDPNHPGEADTDAANGGSARIGAGQLVLAADTPGTSNAFVNHNFVNPVIISNGNFSVSVDVTANPESGNGQGGGFAVGMSQAEAISTGDAFNGNPRMTGAFGTTIGSAVSGQVLADFWLILRGNNSLVWGSNTGNILGVAGLPSGKLGTISATFELANFNTGSSVDYEVFLNGVSQGTGSFIWSGTSENYIGLDGRANVGVTLDNFSVTTAVPEPRSITFCMFMIVVSVCAGRQRNY